MVLPSGRQASMAERMREVPEQDERKEGPLRKIVKMSSQHVSTNITKRSSALDTRLQGRWLLLARGLWGVLVIATLVIVFASLPMYLAQLHTPCAGSACGYLQLTPEQAEALKGMGLFPGVYTASTVTLTLATLMVCLGVSTLIVWRRSDDPMALIVALLLVALGPLTEMFNVSASPSPWQVPNQFQSLLFVALFLLVLSLFPTGRFVPRWMRWSFVAFLAVQVPFTFFPALAALHISAVSLGFLVFVSGVPLLVGAQLYRYRRVSSPRERQQTKWVVFGLAVPITYMILGMVLYLLFPGATSPGSLYLPAYAAVQDLLLLLIPLSFGFAMLRSRLWDVDVLINRTLVYGVLTIILTTLYVGLVIGLQALLRGMISQDNSVSIMLSTLAIWALFLPLRRRIQRLIDRRFYRHKYDATKIVAAFSTALRNQVDLDQLREQLLAVVQETMQPTHISLWLRTDEHPGNPDTET
jgi:hypothetical protein